MSDQDLTRLDLEYHAGGHALSAHQTSVTRQLTTRCKALAQFILEALPPGRERSLALTKLEESYQWGRESIARNPAMRTSKV